jgi:hypothetical protein
MSAAAKLSAKPGRGHTCDSCGEQVRVSWWVLAAFVPPIAALVLFLFVPYAWAMGGFLAAIAVSLALRIIVVDPPPNILWALQVGSDERVMPSSKTQNRISFDFAVEVVASSSKGAFRLRGPAVQGRPGERFVYLRIGTYAGQTGTDVARRAKISLEGISAGLLDAVKSKPAGVLEVRFAGTDSKGCAACATVPLLGSGWYVA